MSTQGRLIVELCQGCASAGAVRVAAEFARWLNLDLHGLFIEDEALHHLAGLPYVRELRLPAHEWQPVDAERIAADLAQAAAGAGQMLRDAAASLGVPNAFEVLRGDPAETIAALSSASDVIVIAAPTTVGARFAHGLARLHAAAHGSVASVLLLPAAARPQRGTVVALLVGPGDPALVPAGMLAAGTGDDLLLLLVNGADTAAVLERAARLGVPRARIKTRSLAGAQPEDVLHALGHRRETLLVLTRGASAAGEVAAASSLAADRGVPVLLVEPAPPSAARSGSANATQPASDNAPEAGSPAHR